MNSNGRDYYDVLGVPRDAPPEKIKHAYRDLVKKHHPDVAPDKKGAEERFKEISEAYEVLGDAEKRAAYDQAGRAGVDFGAGGFTWDRFTRWRDVEDLFSQDLFQTLFRRWGFEGLFGQAAGRPGGRAGGPEAGSDAETEITVTLEEVARGTPKELLLDLGEECRRCRGSRREPGTSPETCHSCGGTGQMRAERRTPFGYFATVTACPKCGGAGGSVQTCKECRGRGRVPGRRTVTLQVPPGIEGGLRLRLEGQGEPGLQGGPPGDLYVRVRVKPHLLFTREGCDLLCDVPVPFSRAALGGEVEVPTLDGATKLKIPPGTQGGTVLTLRGKGLPALGSRGRGDLHVRVRIGVPGRLSREQRKLLEDFEETLEK